MGVTYSVALPFLAANDGIAAGEAIECINPYTAVMMAEALSRKPGCVGAVAFWPFSLLDTQFAAVEHRVESQIG